MASSLTSTNQYSSYLYVGFFVFIFASLIYFLNQPSSAQQNLRKQAFLLTASAFKNGIHFAHSKFQLSQSNPNKLNLWVENDTGLDFNHNGFPIGTSIKILEQKTPITTSNCIEIWRFVLGPIQPTLGVEGDKTNYWASLSEQNVCVFKSPYLDKMQLSYHSLTGKVEIVK